MKIILITYKTQLIFPSFPCRQEISEDFEPEALPVTIKHTGTDKLCTMIQKTVMRNITPLS